MSSDKPQLIGAKTTLLLLCTGGRTTVTVLTRYSIYVTGVINTADKPLQKLQLGQFLLVCSSPQYLVFRHEGMKVVLIFSCSNQKSVLNDE